MRIVSGIYKGRRLIAPNNLPVRPTTDMAKEALFNILQSRFSIQNTRALDLFAGIGSISFELVSREAISVTAVDIHPPCTDFIKKQADLLGIKNLNVVCTDVFNFISRGNKSEGFDLIFADPPYQLDKIDILPPSILETASWLNKNGLLIIEHDKSHNFQNTGKFLEERKYGKVHFSFFRA